MTMIEERYCSFEVSKLLEEKGFDAQCRAAYTNYGKLFTTQIQQYITNIICSESNLWECVAPTPQMVRDWLRKKGILLWVYPAICLKVDDNRTFHWMWDGKKQRHDAQHFGDKHSYDSYEKAEEAAIKYGLTKLI